MTKNLVALAIFISGLNGFAQESKQATIVGPTIITLNKKDAPEEERQLIKNYILNFKTCEITENGPTSSYVRCDQTDSVILSGLSAYDALPVLLDNGFKRVESSKFDFAGKKLTRLTVQR